MIATHEDDALAQRLPRYRLGSKGSPRCPSSIRRDFLHGLLEGSGTIKVAQSAIMRMVDHLTEGVYPVTRSWTRHVEQMVKTLRSIMMVNRRPLIGLLLFLFVACVYYVSPVHYLSDSSYSLLMDEAILQHGTPNMLPYRVERGQGVAFPKHGYLYTIDIVRGRLLYILPWGSSLLSLPSVAISDALGFKAAPDGIYDANNERKMQATLAAIVCAACVYVLYTTATAFLSCGWSVVIALSAAFGTPLWSSASRSLWPQTWYLLLITLVIWVITRDRIRPVLLGTLLAWACFTRPQALPIAIVVSVYVLIDCEPAVFPSYIVTGSVWAAAFCGTMRFFFGHLLPPTYQESMAGIEFWHGLTPRISGLLLSPSRGLFIFVPVILFPLYLTVRYWLVLPRRRLALLALVVIALHVIVTGSWGVWWGGWSYGPRLLMETIPWFVLLSIVGVRAFVDDPQLGRHERSAVLSAVMLLLTVSVAMNAVGALSLPATMVWNAEPSISERVWDWRHPQFLSWVQAP